MPAGLISGIGVFLGAAARGCEIPDGHRSTFGMPEFGRGNADFSAPVRTLAVGTRNILRGRFHRQIVRLEQHQHGGRRADKAMDVLGKGTFVRAREIGGRDCRRTLGADRGHKGLLFRLSFVLCAARVVVIEKAQRASFDNVHTVPPPGERGQVVRRNARNRLGRVAGWRVENRAIFLEPQRLIGQHVGTGNAFAKTFGYGPKILADDGTAGHRCFPTQAHRGDHPTGS